MLAFLDFGLCGYILRIVSTHVFHKATSLQEYSVSWLSLTCRRFQGLHNLQLSCRPFGLVRQSSYSWCPCRALWRSVLTRTSPTSARRPLLCSEVYWPQQGASDARKSMLHLEWCSVTRKNTTSREHTFSLVHTHAHLQHTHTHGTNESQDRSQSSKCRNLTDAKMR